MTVKDAAKKWRVSAVRVNQLCNQGRIAGAVRHTTALWDIPNDAVMPERLRPGPRRVEKADA